MTVVARLLPRLWDGRRLLQFLTGLALIALAFAAPALAAVPQPPTPAVVVTTVDAPVRGAVTDRVAEPAAAGTEAADSGAGHAPIVLSVDRAGSKPFRDGDVRRPGSVAQRPFSGRGPPLA
ncbi:hypothetical protein AB0J80_15670 [Actinoplanes sp. NPDC049548]|uniref:hypothetical protein n=1 Tax=Actinoplanes sp. NPDC049548 TaxID=3155152 RepID=UPI00342F3AEA